MNILSYLGRGIAHEHSGLPCQDALAFRRADNGNLIAALSDGAGSARFAAEAARETVDAVTDFFSQITLDEFAALDVQDRIQAVLDACRGRLTQLWKQLGEPELKHLSATLEFLVVSRDRLLLGHLGDGTSMALGLAGQTMLHCKPERNAITGNSTYFVLSSHAHRHLQLHLFDRKKDPVDFVVMTSDGPYEMFSNRWDNDPVATAAELQGYVRQGRIACEAELADVLNQMAEVSLERMDDWSVLIWSASAGFAGSDTPPQPRSMFREEEQKYGKTGPSGP